VRRGDPARRRAERSGHRGHRSRAASLHAVSLGARALPAARRPRARAEQGGLPDRTPMTTLVTGAAGFIASHVVVELLRAGHEVRGTIRTAARGEALRAAISAAGAPIDRLTL